MQERVLHRFFDFLARMACRYPWRVLTLAALLVAAALATTLTSLRFEPNRNDLISPDLEWNQHFIDWQNSFPGVTDLYVIIDPQADGLAAEADKEARQAARNLADELGEALQQLDTVEEVVWAYDQSQVHPRAARLLPLEQYRAQLDMAVNAQPLLQSTSPAQLMQQALAAMNTSNGAQNNGEQDLSDDIRSFADMIDGFAKRMRTPAQQPIDLFNTINKPQRNYLTTDNGKLLIMRITPRRVDDPFNPLGPAIEQIRQTIDQMRGEYPSVAFGLTGIEVIEADETEAAMFDSMIASIIAAVLIATLLVLAFHSVRTPLMLMVTLAVAVAWSFGYLTLIVGHLQVISVIFTVILLGLGVGFGIHFASRFELVRHNYPDDIDGFEQALADTFRTMGPGILTGAITTAAAFSTTIFTNFTGVAEMGIIAAGGILLCLAAMFTVFPALLRLTKPGHRHIARLQDRFLHFFEETWVMPFVRHARQTLIGAGILTALALIGVSQMRFDYNLLELLPRNIASAKWQQRIVEVGEESVYFGISVVDDLDEARQLAEQFRKLDSTQPQLGGIARLFPANKQEKLAALREARDKLGSALTQPPAPPTDLDTAAEADLLTIMQRFNLVLNLGGGLADASLQPALDELKQSLSGFLNAADALDEETRRKRLDALREDFITFREQTRKQLQGLLDPSPIQPDDLPPSLLNSYIAVDDDGSRRFALEIYPKTPEGIRDPLDPRFLGSFIEEMRSVDPRVTGVIVQIYESGRLIWTSYVQAGFYALIAVFVLVWIDFRSVRDAALTLVPVGAGFAITFGLMYLLGLQINPANIIVLPLMFGIGVDAGVHILHRFRMDRVTRPLGLSAGTGKAISLTSYTTMIGFGSMLVASHRGIQSLGMVLSVGIGMTLLACWSIMPAWLELRARKK